MKKSDFYMNDGVTVLALTIRHEQRLLVINNSIKATRRISIKSIFSAIALTIINLFIYNTN